MAIDTTRINSARETLTQWKAESVEGMSLEAVEAMYTTVSAWLADNFDDETRSELVDLVEAGCKADIIDRFYTRLAFGTGGMRGVMAAGQNRMNTYTVAAASRGLAEYVKSFGEEACQRGIAVSYDSRNNSRLFAEISASVFASNGIPVHIFTELHPVPMVAFALQKLGCIAGVMLTASHNPPAYNGYKVFWEDGCQVVPPHDKAIIERVNAIEIGSVAWEDFAALRQKGMIQDIPADIDEAFYECSLNELTDTEAIAAEGKNIKIVFSPIHGTGNKPVRTVLERAGFSNVSVVKEQVEPDGNFPTVEKPNPEEKAALDMALKQARKEDADLVVATDPDGDRVGIAVRDLDGEFILLNGNQTGALLIDYKLQALQKTKKMPDNPAVVSTIVTTGLIEYIARGYDVAYFETLTGFKHIGTKIREFTEAAQQGEKTYQFVIGGEESYGYLIGDFIRDKDAVTAIALIAEITAAVRAEGRTIYEYLLDIYRRFGAYKESLISIQFEGKSGMERMQKIMQYFRKEAPGSLGEELGITSIRDYQDAVVIDRQNGSSETLSSFPKSNVLQFALEDGRKVSVRPSGTEPKIKLYFSSRETVDSQASEQEIEKILENLDTRNETLEQKMRALVDAVE